MKLTFSVSMVGSAVDGVRAASQRRVAVDVASLARQIQKKTGENVAVEDIEALIVKVADDLHAPMYLSGLTATQVGEWFRPNRIDSTATAGSLRADTAKWHN
jgi:hypothetical protein